MILYMLNIFYVCIFTVQIEEHNERQDDAIERLQSDLKKLEEKVIIQHRRVII